MAFSSKKGYSRSRSSKGASSESELEDNGKRKRYNISKEERLRGITYLQQLLQSLNDQIRLKHTRIDKALSIKDYKL